MSLPKASPWPFAGIGALVALLFLFVASILFVPLAVVIVLVVCWLVLFVYACRHFDETSMQPMWAAVVAAVLWLLVAVVGEVVFGW